MLANGLRMMMVIALTAAPLSAEVVRIDVQSRSDQSAISRTAMPNIDLAIHGALELRVEWPSFVL